MLTTLYLSLCGIYRKIKTLEILGRQPLSGKILLASMVMYIVIMVYAFIMAGIELLMNW